MGHINYCGYWLGIVNLFFIIILKPINKAVQHSAFTHVTWIIQQQKTLKEKLQLNSEAPILVYSYSTLSLPDSFMSWRVIK